jgi:tyrosyl-tRNA synthetase
LTVTKADPDGGLSFTEFSYQIFQSYDWLHLHREFDCSVQLGGSDQASPF